MHVIPLCEPDLTDTNDRAYPMAAVLRSEVSGQSRYVRKFEDAFAEYIGTRYAVAVTNGSAALETALHAVGVSDGDEVILPSFTVTAAAWAVIRRRAHPVIVDVDPISWLINIEDVYDQVNKWTRVVMPMDTFGHPCPISDYMRHLTPFSVVEDACQGLGASTPVGKCGSIADAGCFSFYANKLITTGEGGMITTNDPETADRARSFRNQAYGEQEKFDHKDEGWNCRLNGLSAALGLAQMTRIDTLLAKKRRVARMYRGRLGGNPRITFQWDQPWAKPAYWMTAITTDLPQRIVRRKLAEHGIQTREFFKGLHTQDALEPYLDRKYECPVTDYLYARGFYLPSGPNLTEDQVDCVCNALEKVLG